MEVTDFSRSFLTFRLDTENHTLNTVTHRPPSSLNNARIQIDCRCRLSQRRTGQEEEFFLGANCKTERVGVERDIWTQPNADYVPVFSTTRFLCLKTYANASTEVELYPPGSGRQTNRQQGRVADSFDRVNFHIQQTAAQELTSPEQIVEATFAGKPLVAQTEYSSGDTHIWQEYPVKTMNVNERAMTYQTDTGPILFPDLEEDPFRLETLDLAFAAFNARDWTEFIVRVRTPLESGEEVFHYALPQRLDAVNRLFALDLH